MKNPPEFGFSLSDQGIETAEQVASLFLTVRQLFDNAALEVRDERTLADWRNAWLARKTGVLTMIGDNWLKKAPASQKGEIGKQFNQLKLKWLQKEREVMKMAMKKRMERRKRRRKKVMKTKVEKMMEKNNNGYKRRSWRRYYVKVRIWDEVEQDSYGCWQDNRLS